MTFKVLYSPAEAIKEAKKGSVLKSAVLVILSAVIIAFSSALIVTGNSPIATFLNSFLAITVAAIAFAVLMQIFMGVVRSKWSFYSALTPISLALFVKSVGVLIFALVLLTPLANVLSLVLGMIILAILGVYAFAILIKAGMELYDTDLLTMIVAVLVIYSAVFVGLYVSVFGLSMTGQAQQIAGQAAQAFN